MQVTILGGGIGGLTCAVALARRGIPAVVIEEAPELTAIGAGIWLPTNAMAVMAELGLADELVGSGVPLDRIEVADGDRVLSAIDLGRVRARFGHTTVSLRRSALQRVLAHAVGAAALRLGVRAERALPSGQVHLADGQVIDAEVVIGADGIRSTARAAVSRDVELRYAGQTCYRGLADLTLDAAARSVCREVWARDGRVRFGYSAVAADQVYWFLPVVAPAGERQDGPVKSKLAELTSGFPPPIPDIVAATPDDAISRLDLYDVPTPACWYAGRVVLVGDAAHAMTPNLGQGGAQAIEDAFVLAAELAEHRTLETAFAAYQARRRPRVQRIAKLAWRFGKMAHYRSGFARGLRNVAMRALPDALARRHTDWLYSADLPAAGRTA